MTARFHRPAEATPGEYWPCSADAEQSLIVEVMVRPALIDDFPDLKPAHFHWSAHIATYAHILDMRARGEVVHPIALGAAMEGSGAFDGIEEGATAYLQKLVAAVTPVPSSWVKGYARTIRTTAMQRACIQGADRLIGDMMNPPPGEALESVQARGVAALGAIEIETVVQDRSIGAFAGAAAERGLTPRTDPRDAIHIGVDALDDKLKGLRGGEVCVVAGRPGMGKSIFANRVSRSAAESGLWVLSFQFEMTSQAVAARMICDVARDAGHRVFYSHFRDGSVSPRHRQAVLDAADALTQWPLEIDDKPNLTVDDIAAAARSTAKRAAKASNRLGLIVVDHIGLVRPAPTYRGNKVAETTEITNGLKRLAKELGCAVLAVCQLNRSVENRDDKRPILSDLRESGSIEQDADCVLLLYREAYYLKQKEAVMTTVDYQIEMRSCEYKLEVNVAKCRDGEPGLVIADIDAATASVRDMGAF